MGTCSSQCPPPIGAAAPDYGSITSSAFGVASRFYHDDDDDAPRATGERSRRRDAESDSRATGATEGGCLPARKKLERWHLLNGLVEAEVIEDCAGASAPTAACRRAPLIHIFHPHSPFERRIDVGQCAGSCFPAAHARCRPVANATVAMNTPAGRRSVPVIRRCGCTETCYRAAYPEVYYEATYNKTSRQMSRRVKEIDVGVCIGGCQGVKRQKCVLRDQQRPLICLMSLIKRQTSCTPTRYAQHEFLTPNMDLKTVVSILECGCK